MAVGSSSLLTGFCSPKLGLTEWTSGSSVVVSVIGEVDIATTTQLSDALAAAMHRDVKGLVCDLSGVSFLGAAGVTTLLAARRRAIACHAWFDLVCPQPFPRKVITLLGLDAVFNVYDRLAEAVGAQARHVDRPGLTTAPEAG
jgi:anti-anti-sigma factor